MTRRKDTTSDGLAETEPAIVTAVATDGPLPEATIADPVDRGSDSLAEPESFVPDPLPDLTSAPDTPLQPPAPRRRGSGFVGALLGGALAAVAGFALSHFDVLGLQGPDISAPLAELKQVQAADRETIAQLEQTAASLATRLAALEDAPAAQPDPAGLDDLDRRVQTLEATPPGTDTALAAQVAELQRQIAARPADGGPGAAEVEAALARLAEVEAEAQARSAEAEALAAQVARAGALETLAATVASGAGFEAELQAVDDPALQAALQPHVAGLAPIARLQADFPEAARAALDVARAASEETGWTARLTDFLADQTGARPVTPQEGTTPEAILSRAEFALSEGRVADALAELQALDPATRAPLEPWIADATARVTVEAALAEAR